MNRLLWLTVAAVAVILWFTASTVMAGLFGFVPLAVFIWGWLTPAQPSETEQINDTFWSLIHWNAKRG